MLPMTGKLKYTIYAECLCNGGDSPSIIVVKHREFDVRHLARGGF